MTHHSEVSLGETFHDRDDYHALVADLLNARDTADPQGRVIELLGERLNVWPVSVLEDRDGTYRSEPLTVILNREDDIPVMADYVVKNGMVHVTYEGKMKAMQIGDMDDYEAAQTVLRELAA